ncbi:MAG: STAS domain-containing protein [Bacteroidetes bacterium]|nr:STAS domain-containing protein [Bacteroidota bacterium]
MEFTFEDKDSIHLVNFSGSFLTQPPPESDILNHINEKIESNCQNFVLNLSEVKIINSSGLGLLIKILTKARTIGGDAVLINVPDTLAQLLLVTKLNTVFKSFNSFEDAVANFNS